MSDDQQQRIGAAYQRVQQAKARVESTTKRVVRMQGELIDLAEFDLGRSGDVRVSNDVLEGVRSVKNARRNDPIKFEPVPRYPSYDQVSKAAVELQDARKELAVAEQQLKSVSSGS